MTEEQQSEDEKRVNKLVERLGRCVGGKLADDVAAEVKTLWARVQGAENRAQSAEATLRLDGAMFMALAGNGEKTG